MVEIEVKEPSEDYLTRRAIKKKSNSLYSHAKTRESKDLQTEKDCKKTITKEEKSKLNYTEFDVTSE